jgi:hypothetical protein
MASSPNSSAASSLTFPHPILTPISGKPTYTSLRQLQKELYANARAIPSRLGGGQNGHLAVLMTDGAYVAVSPVPYVIPVHPGALPVHAAGATAPQMTETNRQYDNTVAQVALHTSMINALRQQLLGAIEAKYVMELEDPNLGYIVTIRGAKIVLIVSKTLLIKFNRKSSTRI